MERVTSSIRFYCRNGKKDKKGFAPIEASLCINGERSFLSLPLKVRPEDFNARKQPRHIARYLDEWRVKFVDIECDMLQNGIPITVSNLKELVRTGGVRTYKLEDLERDFLQDLKHRAECAVYRKYELVFKMLSEALGNVELKDVTNGQLKSFYDFLCKKYKPMTSAGQFQKVRSLFKFAVANGKLKVNPAEGIRVSRGKMVIDFLTEAEIETLVKAEIPNGALQRTLDVFLFMCGSGLAYVDVANLAPSDVVCNGETWYIMKARKKTGVTYTSVLFKFAVDIWKKYEGKLPVLTNQKMNLNLKMIEDLLQFPKHLHCHCARHSMAMMLLNSGVRLETVSAALGHSNTAVTQAHYARLLPKTVVTEISSVITR